MHAHIKLKIFSNNQQRPKSSSVYICERLGMVWWIESLNHIVKWCFLWIRYQYILNFCGNPDICPYKITWVYVNRQTIWSLINHLNPNLILILIVVHVWSYPPHGGMSQYSINSSLVMNSTDCWRGSGRVERRKRRKEQKSMRRTQWHTSLHCLVLV